MISSKIFKILTIAILSCAGFDAWAQGGGAPTTQPGGRAGRAGRAGGAGGPGRGAAAAPIPPQPPVDPNAPIKGPFKWTTGDVVLKPQSDENHQVVSVKDPTIVQFDGKYHIYATTSGKSAGRGGARGPRGASAGGDAAPAAPTAPQQPNLSPGWSFMYTNFVDFKDANAKKFWYAEQNPNLKGYKCAPHLFYYTPQKKWYMVFQTQPPQYVTADDITKPETWSVSKPFFSQNPTGPAGGWIDFNCIADEKDVYLWFTNDGGYLFYSKTSREQFPNGMSEPKVAIQMSRNDLFEASQCYKVKGKDCYLTIVEAMTPSRYFRAWWSKNLDGTWIPVENANSFQTPFAGINNVTFDEGVKPWTRDISHGELIRTNVDETPTIDIDNMQFLFQGRDPASDNMPYDQLPYQLGLLKQVKK